MVLTKEFIWKKIKENYDYVLDRRQWMHRHPELAGSEKLTSAMIEEEIKKLGLPYEKAADYGWLVTMECGKPGKTVALRADIDGLPMDEDPENLKGPKVCVSEHAGCNHACGHDAHTSMLLGSMKILNEVKDQLEGTILFCFEEGEETGTGVMAMLALLDTRKVDAVWAIHMYAFLESGKISVQAGPRMAGVAPFRVTFKGRGGHGSRPDQAISPIFAVADCLSNIATAWANKIDVTKTVTLGVGKIFGGTVSNIIPDEAGFEGSMRFFDEEEGKKAVEIMKNVVEHTAAMHECELSKEQIYYHMGAAINDPALSARAEKALDAVLEPGTVAPCDPWFASESYSHYQRRWPGVFAFLGINNPEKGTGAAHHNVKFEVDDDVLGIGMAATLAYVQEILSK